MKTNIIVSLTFIMLTLFSSCEKSTKELSAEFVKNLNYTTSMLSQNNPSIRSIQAEKSGENEILIKVSLKVEESSTEASMMKDAIPDLISQVLKAEKSSNKLLEQNVSFRVETYSSQNKLISFKDFNKDNIEKSNLSFDTNNMTKSGVNELLKSFNKYLPQTDSETGIKIMKMEAGDDNDIYYYAEIPDELVEVIKMEESKVLIKEELLRDPKIRNVLNSTKQFNINKLKYIYSDKKGSKLSEITILESDYK